MKMKDYYQILGVGQKATAREIKRTFRQLAIRYHPDKNPTPEAEELFKDINEAYEVLSDAAARAEYDLRVSNSSTLRPPPATKPEDHATVFRPATSSRRAGPSDRMVFMYSIHRYSQLLFFFGCFWSVLLIVDYMMPSTILEEEVVTDMESVQKIVLGAISPSEGDLLITDKGHHFPLMIHELKYFPPNSKLKIHKSNLLSALIKVENYDGSFEVNNLATIYRNLSFAPLCLLFCCAVGLAFPKGLEFHVNLGIVVFLLMVLNIVFLFNSRL
jgi:hypothetical protein